MSTTKILLVLGAGGNIGASVSKLFAQNGYKVALVARRLKDGTTDSDGNLNIQADLADSQSVESAFDKVTAQIGVPNVVVYNAASVAPVSADDPLALPLASYDHDIAINTRSVLVAAQRAVQGFQKLPNESSKTFIYTGNVLNKEVIPAFLSLGIGKSASAHLIAVASQAYASQGFRFYYADERKADGSPAFRDISGPNHAAHYLGLVESGDQKPWLQTFVGGQGYKVFD